MKTKKKKAKAKPLSWIEQLAKNFDLDPDSITMETSTPIEQSFDERGVPRAEYTGDFYLTISARKK